MVELVDELISEYQQSCRATDLETVTKAAEEVEAVESFEPVKPYVPENSAEPSEHIEPVDAAADVVKDTPAAIETPAPAQTATDAVDTNIFEKQEAIETPDGVSPSLWNTFRRELKSHAMRLNQLFNAVGTENHSEELPREILRTLHTIKSASMVIPLDPVTRCTHQAESLVQAATNNEELWKSEGLAEYLSWLEAINDASIDVNSTLATSVELEALLTVQSGQRLTVNG